MKSGPEVVKLFSCSTQLSMKFQLLLKLKYQQMKKSLALSLLDVVFIMLINVKMPAIVGILIALLPYIYLIATTLLPPIQTYEP